MMTMSAFFMPSFPLCTTAKAQHCHSTYQLFRLFVVVGHNEGLVHTRGHTRGNKSANWRHRNNGPRYATTTAIRIGCSQLFCKLSCDWLLSNCRDVTKQFIRAPYDLFEKGKWWRRAVLLICGLPDNFTVGYEAFNESGSLHVYLKINKCQEIDALSVSWSDLKLKWSKLKLNCS